MTISSSSVKELARLGVDLEITGNAQYSASSVMEIIRIVIQQDSHIKIHAAGFSSSSLKEMAKLSSKHVSILI